MPTTQDAAALPAFEEGKFYRVQLKEPVELPAGSGNYLSPENEVNLEGTVAKSLKGKISGAVPI